MFSSTRHISFLVGFILILFGNSSLNATTPPPPPGFIHTGGVFAEYFNNAVTTDCDYTAGEILVGFHSDPYLKPRCITGFLKSDGGNSLWLSNNSYKLGLGTGSADYTLDLSGSLRLNLPGSEGANLVLTSDANGVASWYSIPNMCTPAGLGVNNLCHGIGALQYDGLSGGYNLAVGDYSLSGNIIGSYNTALGYSALRSNNASSNTAIGFKALFLNSTGHHNIAIGVNSLSGNVSGSENIGIGYGALSSNNTGNYNIALGNYSLNKNIKSNIIAIGHASLAENTIGDYNTSIGSYALRFNSGGNANTAFGYYALNSNQIGSNNVAIGVNAGLELLGSRNTLVGRSAGALLGTGGTIDDSNTFIGYNAGQNQISGSSNIIIGSNLTLLSNTGSNQLNIGGWIYGTGGNIGIGNNNPRSRLHISGDLTTSRSVTFQHYESTWGSNALRSFLKKGFDGGDYLYLGVTGNDSNANRVASFYKNANFMVGLGSDSATGLTVQWMNVSDIGLGIDTTPSYPLDVSGSTIRIKNPSFHYSNIRFANLVDNNGIIEYNSGSMNFYTKNIFRMTIGSGGNIGLGTSIPGAKLTIGNNLEGAAMSKIFKVNAGILGGNINDSLSLASIGFTSSNASAFGIRALRTANTPDDSTTAGILLSMDVDDTLLASSAFLMIHPNGSLGIGKTNPSPLYKLDVAGTGAFQSVDAGKSISFAQSNPFIQFNSGGPTISLPSANTLAVSTSGVERMRVDNNGNIGIADTTPSYKLDVAGTGAFMGLRVTVGASAGKVLTSDATGNATWQSLPSGLPIGIVGNTMYHNGTAWVASSNIYNNNTNIGIGGSTPTEKLDIFGNTKIRGLLKFATTNPDAAGTTGILGNPNGWTRLDPNGQRFIITATPSQVSAKANILDIENSSTWQHMTELRADGSAYFAGNVGIGTSTPTAKLEVMGQIKITGGSPGIGKILTSDASGLATWSTPISSFSLVNDTWLNSTGDNKKRLYFGLNGKTYFGSQNGYEWRDASDNPIAFVDNTGTLTAKHIQFGNGNANTETRDNASLRGDAGAKSGFFETSNPTNYPAGATSWWHLIDTRHSNNGNNYALQIAGSFYDQNLYFRKTNNSTTQAWSKLVAEDTTGKVGIGTSSPLFKLDINGDVINNGWYRSRGDTGWFSETYRGGLYMTDTTWIRTFGDKSFYHNTGIFRTDGTLQVGPNGDRMIVNTEGNVGIGNTTPSQKLTINGNVLASGFIYSSDRNLKKDIIPLSDSLSKIISLNGYTFVWNKSGVKDIGVIAQEVEKVFPDIVHTDAETGMKSVEYGNLIAPVIEAIKSQQRIIEEQNIRIQSLEKRLEALEAKIK